MRSAAVVIPVKDGQDHLEELLAAVLAQRPDEVLVIDSGSRDRSLAIIRAAGVDLLEIEPATFGHGRTRNLGVEKTDSDLICFLTQDAVPVPGWLAAHRSAFDRAERVGASYGPHLPRPDTSPMIARELGEFFASMSPDATPALHGDGDITFLSNVNACYSRECVEEVRFADVAYAEDQAFGESMLNAGWVKVFEPAAGVLHAHDYGPGEFARRYFDEARGLAEAHGHLAPRHPAVIARQIQASVAGDHRWMAERGYGGGRRLAWTARSVVHHSSRRVAEALGTRHQRLPAGVQRRLSLEGRASQPQGAADVAPTGKHVRSSGFTQFRGVLEISRKGPAALLPPVPGRSQRQRLHLAFVLPFYSRGSGGHNTISQTIRRLEDMGHTCSIWMHDPTGRHRTLRAGSIRHEIREWFAPVRAPVFVEFDDWHGADIAVATGWETAHPTALLTGCAAKAYLINDHEPEFFGTSIQARWAEETYGLGLFPISASTWLRDLIGERYDSHGTAFRLGVDHRTYWPDQVPRRDDTVLVYARSGTERRAVPLVLMALDELKRRRPSVRVVLFGQDDPLSTDFDHEQLGVASPGQLALNYCEATVGLCLSLTNYSLIPQEMMACGLPCVDVGGGSSEAVFGSDGPLELADADPLALADAMEKLLADEDRWKKRSEAGLLFVADADWDEAAREIEAGLRQALRERER